MQILTGGLMLHLENQSRNLSEDSPAARFRRLCCRYSELARSAGVRVTPYRPGAPEPFRSLPAAQQAAILNGLETTVRICERALEHGDLNERSLPLVWWAFRELKLRPRSD